MTDDDLLARLLEMKLRSDSSRGIRLIDGSCSADGLIVGLGEGEGILSRVLPYTGEVIDSLMNELLVFHPRP